MKTNMISQMVSKMNKMMSAMMNSMMSSKMNNTSKKAVVALTLMLTGSVAANAMSYSEARTKALYLADKMAYELNLTNDQYEAAYEINLDYLMAVDSRYNVYGSAWTRRNNALQHVLTVAQWRNYERADYFYRPVSWQSGRWQWNIYSRYNANRYFRTQPVAYNNYRGGRSNNYYASRSWGKPTHTRTTTTRTVTTTTNNRNGDRQFNGTTTTTSNRNGQRQFDRKSTNSTTTTTTTRTTTRTSSPATSTKQVNKNTNKTNKSNSHEGTRRFGGRN